MEENGKIKCTANKYAEKRPYKRMEDELFYSIIDQLKDWGYKGHLTLYGNNEPWLDTRIVEFHRYCRKQLPDCFIFMSTNGLLLDIDKVKAIVPYVDQLIINNYCLDMKLHDNVREIYEYARENPKNFEKVDILIQIRYMDAVLTNRAGSAPNKKNNTKVIKETCLMPFTDMFIFPFCKFCDFIDAGLRMDAVDDVLKNSGKMRGARQSFFAK